MRDWPSEAGMPISRELVDEGNFKDMQHGQTRAVPVEIVVKAKADDNADVTRLRLAIADTLKAGVEAVMLERERCAKIAETFPFGDEIAERIRSGE